MSDNRDGLGQTDVVDLLACQTRVLALMSAGAALPTMLDAITSGLEQLMPASRCSLLLLDDGGALRHGSAPSLPTTYLNAIDGLAPGPAEGSCGTAAWLGTPVVVADIEADTRWRAYLPVAQAAGLRACWSTPVLGATGGVVGTFAVYHDCVHEPTSREHLVVERLTYLASVAIEHAAMIGAVVARRSAEAASRAKSAFLSAIGHEMRTPLQAITGFTELLTTLDLDERRRTEALGHVANAASHLLELVDDTLDLSRIEAGALPLELRPVPTAGVIAEVLQLLAPVAAENDVGLVADSCDCLVTADERRLRQVLINLVSNGIRYSGPAGIVRVEATSQHDAVTLTVTDNGPGIEPSVRDRLFEPFVRAQDGGDGVGLGLMLTRGLTEAMGGRLDVAEAPAGPGTRATVTLGAVTAARLPTP